MGTHTFGLIGGVMCFVPNTRIKSNEIRGPIAMMGPVSLSGETTRMSLRRRTTMGDVSFLFKSSG